VVLSPASTSNSLNYTGTRWLLYTSKTKTFLCAGISAVRSADIRYISISENRSANLGNQGHTQKKATLVKGILHNFRIRISVKLHYAESFNSNHHT